MRCGIESDRTLRCWGNDASGQLDVPPGTFLDVSVGSTHVVRDAHRPFDVLGAEMDPDRALPTPPPGAFDTLALRPFHGCAVGVDGSVRCWGRGSALNVP